MEKDTHIIVVTANFCLCEKSMTNLWLPWNFRVCCGGKFIGYQEEDLDASSRALFASSAKPGHWLP